MTIKILHGDCLEVLAAQPSASVHCCVTSPPYYGLRDYGLPPTTWPAINDTPAMTCCLGLEPTPAAFIDHLVLIFREVRRVLRPDGTLWLNIGDSYCSTDKWGGGGNTGRQTVANDGTVPSWAVRQRKAPMPGIKPKDLIGVPWMLAFALRADGWHLRQDIIWHKPNPMPEPVRDRCTKAHEYVFLLSKSERYYFDSDAMQEPAVEPRGPGNKNPVTSLPGERKGENHNLRGSIHKIGPRKTRNKRSVWTISTKPFKGAHFATMAPTLAETCIKAGCPIGGTVLDPFGGAGTTGVMAASAGRQATLIELNPEYIDIARNRIAADAPLFAEVA